ncbi:SseB family protein [Neomicrococcus aestuarii]|uniref:SseB protein N-terminal domain-containing protein n=1 Tax=Neomicrococcus aestuarii TaxID=556325 RepID=A0A7W8TUQ7_9MICC|nr:SseB family protein [Neomicrococcus aestuarii]MBB5513264.1 hypothetical protein [Neomicrococcus aestuarii]
MSETPQQPNPAALPPEFFGGNQASAPAAAGSPEGNANQPLTPLESLLDRSQHDESLAGQVIGTFLQSEVFFLSRDEVTPETENVTPLMLENASGKHVIALFSHPTRIPPTYIEQAPYAVKVVGAAVVDNLQNAGMVLNPGFELGFEISEEGVAGIRQDFQPDGTQNPNNA